MPIPETNEASWTYIREFIEDHPDTEHWNAWRATIKPVIERAMSARYDHLFRAGSSMHDIVFSTLKQHRLRDEPRVTLRVSGEDLVGVYYTTSNIQCGTSSPSDVRPSKEIFPVFTRYLQQLWTATMPEPIPELLRKQENYVTGP